MPDETLEEYRIRNPKDWKRLIDGLFSISVPAHAKWEDIDDIILVLNHIGSIKNVNHIFFPDSGGLDLHRAEHSPEEGLVNLILDGMSYYVKPESLTFESFGDRDNYQWSYFRLQLTPISDTGTYKNMHDYITEELLELAPGEYADRSNWDAGEYRGERLPREARVITRILSGSLVIFQKSSAYNGLSHTYSAPHNKVDASRFRQEVSTFRQNVMSGTPNPGSGLVALASR